MDRRNLSWVLLQVVYLMKKEKPERVVLWSLLRKHLKRVEKSTQQPQSTWVWADLLRELNGFVGKVRVFIDWRSPMVGLLLLRPPVLVLQPLPNKAEIVSLFTIEEVHYV
jgi:hypothetical protein